jgi:hypothetical protein
MLSAQSTAVRGSRTAETPRRKPLYLATRTPIRVAAEAESLVVRGAGNQMQRFPVARLDRIVCNRHTDWSGEALALCLRRGITVTWVDGAGCALGDCSPRLADASSLDAWLERYVESPRWTTSHGNWLRRRRMTLLVTWARARLASGFQVARDEWETLKREFVYKGVIHALLPAELHGWCHAFVVARLHSAGLHARYWGYDGTALELAEDLTALLWAAMNLDAGTLATRVSTPRTLAMAFEAGTRGNEANLRDQLAHLRLHVGRAIDAWL